MQLGSTNPAPSISADYTPLVYSVVAPGTSDVRRVGTTWIDTVLNRSHVLVDVTAGVATWIELASVTAAMYTGADATDPASSVATSTAKVDAYSGVIITLTAVGNAQTLGAPTVTTAGKTYYVVNNDTSTDNIDIIGASTVTLVPGEAEKFMWDGSAWIHITGVDADEITYNPAASYITETNIQAMLDDAFTTNGFLFTKGSQNYLFTDNGNDLALQGQSSSIDTDFNLFSKDGDATDGVTIHIYGKGTPGAITDSERLVAGWNVANSAYMIYTDKTGSGTAYPLIFNTSGNTNQLYLATDGKVGIGTSTVNANLVIKDDNLDMLVLSRSSTTNGDGSELIFHTTTSEYAGTDAGISAKIAGIREASGVDGRLDFYTRDADASSLSASLKKDAMLDLYGGTISILAGADSNLKTRGATSRKLMRFAVPHYTLSELPMAVILADADNGANSLTIGGGTSTMNSITTLAINVADNSTTHTGTEVARFEGGATKALMMGLGNSSLKGWGTAFNAMQINETGALYSYNGATDNTTLASNYYFSTGNRAIIDDGGARLTAKSNGTIEFVSYTAPASFVGDGSASDDFATETVKVNIASGANGLITLSGGTGGVRLDNLVGINTAPSTYGLSISGADASTSGIGLTNSTGANTWRMSVADTDEWKLRDITGAVDKIVVDATVDGLVLIDGNAGGVRLDNTVGIGVAPNVNRALYLSGAVSATGTYWGFSLDKTITANVGNSAIGIAASSNFVTNASGTHPSIVGAFISAPTVTDAGASITNLASLYVEGAPSFAGTATNGPYSIFVDAGDVRFDGGFVMGGGTTPQAQQAHIVDADGSLADITTKFNTLLADFEGYGFLASA